MSCDDVEGLVDELALDTLPGDVRALALEHLAGCPSCRTSVEQLSAIADAVLLVAPMVEPPPGFDLRVQNAIHESRGRRPSAGRRSTRRPRVVRMTAAAAAVAAIVALAGAGVLKVESGGRRQHLEPAASALAGNDSELRTAKLIGIDGSQLGDVSIYAGSPAWLFMRVDRARLTTTYRCVLDLAGGQTVALGDLWVANGKGAWGQHVDLRGQQVRDARLINATGHTVATATFT
jgi:Putative zinc-finger